MREPVDLTARPTADQLSRFRALSPEERFRWFAGLLRTTHGLASPEAKEGWRAHKQAQAGGFVSVVCAFVRALEESDLEEASSCLSEAVIYDAGSGVVRGVQATLSACTADRSWRAHAVDRVRHRSRIEAVGPGVVQVTFEDEIEHRGHAHRHRYLLEMTVGRSKLVETIRDREVEGQRVALDAFLAAAGIEAQR